MKQATAQKAKISITVDRQLLARAVRIGSARTRSQIIETALSDWVAASGKKTLDKEIERYYLEQSDAERTEDATWAAVGDEALRGDYRPARQRR